MDDRRSIPQRVVYRATQWVMRVLGVACCALRVEGREHVPGEGSVLVCPNHQSYFDPVLAGVACDRWMNYLARETLFRFSPFRWLIEFYNAIPIDREGGGLSGIKETLKRLRREEMVLIFPEGTRSLNGEVSPLKPGFCTIARRGRAPLLPVGIDGAYDAWPRHQSLPLPAPINVVIGEPISYEEICEMTDIELIAELETRIRACHARARTMRKW